MKRISEIKKLLNMSYFDVEEAPYVIMFLKEIGFKQAERYVYTEPTISNKRANIWYYRATDFFSYCIEHSIGSMFSAETAMYMAIEDYKYQVNELKSNSNSQKQIDNDKGTLYGFLVASFLTEASMGEILKAAKPEDAENIRQILKRVLE